MNYFDSIYSDSLPSRAVTVYLYLVQRANSDGQCWPSERRIAMDLSMSKSTVKRAIADLSHMGHADSEPKLMGRNIGVSMSPVPQNQRKLKYSGENENVEDDSE